MTMRKAFAAFLAVFLVLAIGFWYLHSVLLGVSDDVTVTREILYGDPAAAEGVNVLVRNHFGNKLLWETELTLGEDARPETAFTFSNQSIRIATEQTYLGVSILTSGDIFQLLTGSVPEYAEAKYSALIQALSKRIDAVPEGTSETFAFDLAEYLEYYPLEGQIDLPGYTTVFSECQPWMQDSEQIARAFNDFFKIPVTGELMAEIQINKTDSGSTYGAQLGAAYYPSFTGVVTGDACYFTFNAVTDAGVVADTGHIPGGYGIYCLPYEGSRLDFDNMKLVCSLDPAESYESMSLSGDGKRIRLLSWQGEDLMLTVIDIETMSQVQKVKLLTSSQEDYHDVIPYDDFLLILEDRYHSGQDVITVWEELEDGSMNRVITADVGYDVFPEGEKLYLFSRYENAVDYRDGKLVVIKNRLVKNDEVYRTAKYGDIYVVVYDASGMVYAGTCHWNLTDVNALYYNNVRVTASAEAALEVSW